MKRTPLKRKVGLKRSGPLGRRHGIRKQSQKRAVEAKKYGVRRKAFLEENFICFACATIFGDQTWHPSTEVHHKELRGPNYLKEETWLAVCRKAHSWIHDNAKAARLLGLLK